MNKIRRCLFFSILMLCLSYTGLVSADVDSRLTEDPRFMQMFNRAGGEMLEAAQKRPFKLASMNDSLSLGALAFQHVNARQWDKALAFLQKAQEQSKENSLVLLMEALVSDELRQTAQANRLYQKFYAQSRTITRLDSKYMSPWIYHELRRGVFELLKARGLSPKEFNFSPDLPWKKSFWKNQWAYLQNPLGRKKSWLSLAVALSIVLGILFVLLKVLGGLFSWLQERYGPIEKGSRRCRKCHAVISLLMLECPYCKKPV